MLDAVIRPHLNKPLAAAAKVAIRLGVTADAATALGFALGMTAAALAAAQFYWPALVFLLISRFLDGLDGAIARETRATDLGVFLDLSLDFIFYVSVVFAFALADPERNALAAAFLTTSFMVPVVTSLAFAVSAVKRGAAAGTGGLLSYLSGMTDGGETIVVLCLMCAFPDWFAVVAVIYGILCWVAGGTRIAEAVGAFDDVAAQENETKSA